MNLPKIECLYWQHYGPTKWAWCWTFFTQRSNYGYGRRVVFNTPFFSSEFWIG